MEQDAEFSPTKSPAVNLALARLDSALAEAAQATGREYGLVLVPLQEGEQPHFSLSGRPLDGEDRLTVIRLLADRLAAAAAEDPSAGPEATPGDATPDPGVPAPLPGDTAGPLPEEPAIGCARMYLVQWPEMRVSLISANDPADLAEQIGATEDPDQCRWREYDGPFWIDLVPTGVTCQVEEAPRSIDGLELGGVEDFVRDLVDRPLVGTVGPAEACYAQSFLTEALAFAMPHLAAVRRQACLEERPPTVAETGMALAREVERLCEYNRDPDAYGRRAQRYNKIEEDAGGTEKACRIGFDWGEQRLEAVLYALGAGEIWSALEILRSDGSTLAELTWDWTKKRVIVGDSKADRFLVKMAEAKVRQEHFGLDGGAKTN